MDFRLLSTPPAPGVLLPRKAALSCSAFRSWAQHPCAPVKPAGFTRAIGLLLGAWKKIKLRALLVYGSVFGVAPSSGVRGTHSENRGVAQGCADYEAEDAKPMCDGYTTQQQWAKRL